ncbi:hypothetical protein K505DRAFT_340816 [Melanomma pulvis-pyrius CBS 109.77]|uniref:Uncharacterized protein n=1 Tax=Melanomma pulvis-pyrius CBS 109.77 TaxID=1314802 RepID=A0A6A6X0V4_9PLEO|nr:hypothetical protein K505DRAFT_340816 [Melanomma pulvis-pyrius CBS 109.77]
MAEDLFNQTSPGESDIKAIERVTKVLPELLSTFALEIGYRAETQTHRDVMVFIHKNRRTVAEQFERLCLENHHPGQNRNSDSMTVNEKIRRWNRQNEEPEDASFSGQRNDAVFQAMIDNSMAQDSDTEPIESEEDRDIAVASSYTDFVAKTPAYRWLLSRMRREIFLIPSEPNHKEDIRRVILGLLPPCNRPEEVVEKAITLTGSAEDAQAQTCAEYLSQTWPSTGKLIVLLLKDVISSGPGQRHTCESLGGTKLTAWIQESKFMVEAFGTASSVAEVGERLAWLGAALRSSPFESGVGYCTPFLCKNNQPNSRLETLEEPHLLCKIDYTIDKGKEQVGKINGQCWQRLFRNPVIVSGYPIPGRVERNTGLEIPLRLMVVLAQARHVTTFDGNIFIKGFCTMLMPTKHVGNMVTWQVFVNEDGSHISYADPRVRGIPQMHPDKLPVSDVERSRHVIGWCPYVKSYAGTPEANYEFGWSGLDVPYTGDLLKKKTILSTKFITCSESFALGRKDILDFHKYTRKIAHAILVVYTSEAFENFTVDTEAYDIGWYDYLIGRKSSKA